jgi:protein SCO1/2
MQKQWTMRKRQAMTGLSLLAFALVCLQAPLVRGQVSDYGQKEMGAVQNSQPTALSHVAITQKLNRQIPLDGVFRDETGKAVRLGDYFGKRPVILSMVYYQCKVLCPEEIDGLVGALEMVKFDPGKQFDVVFVSIDPTETPEIAAREKALYLKRYGRPETASGWHFLTGEPAAIQALSSAVGFGYTRVPGPDGKLDQFAHASSIELVTPEGKLSQYYLGVEYAPRDLQLGLVEASAGKIGSPVDNILTYCYRYDPTLNRHSLIIGRIVQAGCMLTLLILGSYMVVMFRRDIKEARIRTAKLANG